MQTSSYAPDEPAQRSRRTDAALAMLRGLNLILAITIGGLLFSNDGAALGLAIGIVAFFGHSILRALGQASDDWRRQRRQAAYRKARQ